MNRLLARRHCGKKDLKPEGRKNRLDRCTKAGAKFGLSRR